jgi:hypothetical protein
MNAARSGRVGEDTVQLLQLAGSLDAVVAVVGEYPGTWAGDHRFDQFLVHVLADPQSACGQLPGDRHQFPIEGPGEFACMVALWHGREHLLRTKNWGCTRWCRHGPLPSLYPNLSWTFEKGYCSYDRRKLEFGRTSDLDPFYQAPDAASMSGYESALLRLKVMVNEAVSSGLRDVRVVLSATDPLSLPPHRFSDTRVSEQHLLVNRCMQVCHELATHVDLNLRDVDTLRKFVGPTSNLPNYSFQDYNIPQW